MIAPPELQPLRDGEEIVELGRTSPTNRGWVCVVARVDVGGSSFIRIAAWSPTVQRYHRLDLHPRLVGELVELLGRATL